MSKQFDSKKEAALTLKKFYSALGTNSEKTASSETIDYKSKYNLLLKRFRELEKVFDFHRGLIQNISSGLVTINMQAEITFMNRAALRIFGYEYLSTQGMPVASLFADRNEAETIIDTVLNKQNMLESKEVYFSKQYFLE
jgi:PAS domain-containing protein